MTVPRWLLALVVATGLLAMHGITASTAAAAAPCGAAVPHEHHAVPAEEPLAAQQASEVPPLSGHVGALCLAVLAGGLVVALLARRTPRTGDSGQRGPARPPLTRVARAPPDSLLPLLCVSRT